MVREKYDECHERLIDVFSDTSIIFTNQAITDALNSILIAAGVDIAEPLILPGVTQGDRRPQECSGHIKIFVGDMEIATYWSHTGGFRHPAWEEAQANARLAVASMEVVESVTKYFEKYTATLQLTETQCIFSALKKAGVIEDKFR